VKPAVTRTTGPQPLHGVEYDKNDAVIVVQQHSWLFFDNSFHFHALHTWLFIFIRFAITKTFNIFVSVKNLICYSFKINIMSTYTQILYQIVFSTKNREHTLINPNRVDLYKYIWGLLKNKNCHLYRIGGVTDHIHIVTHLHPSISLASLVKDIKLASSDYIKSVHLFPDFHGWQNGYGGFTYSFKDKDHLIEYVKNQEEHHKIVTFRDELIELLHEHGIEFDEKYLL
jgi:REP element-mobilizing transposase RayT